MVTASVAHKPVPDEDQLRADLYAFLAALLSAPPPKSLLDKCAGLRGDDTPLGQAVIALARVSRATSVNAVEREFHGLFAGGGSELLPYASCYMTGSHKESPRAALRNDMNKLRITRAENGFEADDNIASLCEMMAGQITGRFGTSVDLGRQKEFYNRHIGPWAKQLFSDLEAARTSVFYASVGAIGRAFMDIERNAFRMTAGQTAS
ncbi:MAG: molecular chaperone TorD family protein [Pseudomonadota bacterium]